MRELIISRLDAMKEKERGFSRIATMRWANVFIDYKGRTTHISDVDWNELSDDQLLDTYERVVRRYYSQM